MRHNSTKKENLCYNIIENFIFIKENECYEY